jgi:hypothetical protein
MSSGPVECTEACVKFKMDPAFALRTSNSRSRQRTLGIIFDLLGSLFDSIYSITHTYIYAEKKRDKIEARLSAGQLTEHSYF